jgi:hypothetical protein
VRAQSLFFGRLTLVWLSLVGATLLSFESMLLGGDGARLARCAILVIAFGKATLVGLEFMDLRNAPALLRLPFLGWAVIACSTLLVLTW